MGVETVTLMTKKDLVDLLSEIPDHTPMMLMAYVAPAERRLYGFIKDRCKITMTDRSAIIELNPKEE